MAATAKNVKSLVKSRKVQTRRGKSFVVGAQGFDGRQVAPGSKRTMKSKNYPLARKILENYSLAD